MKEYEVRGIKHTKYTMKPTSFVVMITNNSRGISLSILNETDERMYQIPINKEMLKELIKNETN